MSVPPRMRMRAPRETRLASVLRLATWLCPLIALVAAGSLLVSAFGQFDTIRNQLAARSELRLDQLRDALETHLTHVAITLQTIAAEPGVKRMSADSRDFLQAVYAENYAHHQLSEVYVIESDFDGQRRPFMAFEHEEHEQSIAEIHSLEREVDEYRVQREQIARFKLEPTRRSLVSAPIPLCVGERGLVFSAPIRGPQRVHGIVAGMVPISTLDRLLDTGDSTEAALILDADRTVLANCRVSAATVEKIRAMPSTRAPRRTEHQRVDGAVVFARPLVFGDAIDWTLVFVMDEPARLAALGWASPLPGLGSAVAIGLLGVVSGVLAHTTRGLFVARHEAIARAEQLSHATRVHSMSELATNLAHEISQPLAAIVTFAEASARRTRGGRQSPDAALEDLEAIRQQAARATATIDRVRDFVRNRPPRRTRESLNALIHESVRMLAPHAREARTEIRLDLDESVAKVRADAVQIMQVLVNLIRNGIEAMSALPAADRVLAVSSREAVAGQVECQVADRGPALSEERFERLFTPFETSKPGGLGLGLSISRTIVELHGGRIRAERSRPQGLRMVFALPADRGEGLDVE